MSSLTDKIEKAWKDLLPNISWEYYRRIRQETDYAEKTLEEIFKELQFLGILNADEYTPAQQYILSQKERWVKDIDAYFSSPQRITDHLWPQLIDGFSKKCIERCLTDPEGEEKFAGTVFEAVFDRLIFYGGEYEDDKLKEVESYIFSKKDKWLKEAKAYHKL